MSGNKFPGLLGARLRTKLVFFFLAFVLFPALFMFYGTAAVIRLTVNELLKAPVADAMAAAGRIVDTWARSVETRCVLSANRVAQEHS